MNQPSKQPFFLVWPWNVLIGITATLILGYCLGYLWGVLLVLAFFKWQKKRHPGMPQGGYCMERAHKCLAYVLLGVLFLALAAILAAYAWLTYQGPSPNMVYVIGSSVGSIVCLIVGIYETFANLRDALFPSKSRLANSIRSQLPFPYEAPDVKELFAMVDQDMEKNGLRFDRLMIGKEWVLGDEASYIPNMRGAFIDHTVRLSSNGGNAHIIILCIVDNRRQVQVTELRDPREIGNIITCLQMRAPGIVVGNDAQYKEFCSIPDVEWEMMELKHRT